MTNATFRQTAKERLRLLLDALRGRVRIEAGSVALLSAIAAEVMAAEVLTRDGRTTR